MFLHQFGDDLVLALELLAQGGDGPLVVALGRGVLALEGGGAVLEELLLPEVEQRGGEVVLVTEVGDGMRSSRWSRRMATFSWGLGRFRVFLDMG